MAALVEHGYESLNVEDVAQRAGVHKTTVYRRWPTKAELVADAVRERSADRVEVPDTGSLAGDLQALARAVVASIGSAEGSAMIRTAYFCEPKMSACATPGICEICCCRTVSA